MAPSDNIMRLAGGLGKEAGTAKKLEAAPRGKVWVCCCYHKGIGYQYNMIKYNKRGGAYAIEEVSLLCLFTFYITGR